MASILINDFFSHTHDYETIYKNSYETSLIKSNLMNFTNEISNDNVIGMSKVMFACKTEDDDITFFTEYDNEMIIKYLLVLYTELNNNWQNVLLNLQKDDDEFEYGDKPIFRMFYFEAYEYLKSLYHF